jgi:predicted secreted hydrolase
MARVFFRLNQRRLIPLFLALLLASSFSYQAALPGRKISFPVDHASHPDFKTEWWYYTGHLRTEEGKEYGYQVTFFRFGLRDRQEEKEPHRFTDLYMAHFALSDKQGKRFYFRERANRGYGDKAGSRADRYQVWNEDWKVEERGKSHLIQVRDRDAALTLILYPLKPPVLHGEEGLSRKGEGKGRASYYYSYTRMRTEGELEWNGKKARVRGSSWMDHEFGSDQLGEDQAGWDWFSIQLENNTEIMLYLMRRRDGSLDPYSSGTLVYGNGASRHLLLREFSVEVLDRWKSSRSRANYPMRWRVTIPAEEVVLEIHPYFSDQELETRKSTRVTYWEGAARVQGTYRGRAVLGVSYVEMTGYAGKLRV